MTDLTAPNGHAPTRNQHGGRSVADRLDSHEAILVQIAALLDGHAVTLNGIADNQEAVAGLVAEVHAGQAATAQLLAMAVPPLLDGLGIVQASADKGVWRTFRARRKAAKAAARATR